MSLVDQPELARLRAEVERLKSELAGYQESTVKHDPIERERDEALARMSVLLQRLREEHCQSETCDLHTAPFVEARALLDRLQALQRIVDSLSPLQERLRHHPLRGESDSLVETAIKMLDEARAILDRRERAEEERASLAEDCGEMRKQITRQLVQLRQAEVVVRDLVVLGDEGIDVSTAEFYKVLQAAQNLVAAWDAGKEGK